MTTAHELAMALRSTYLAMHRATDAHLARLGVTADQFVLLAALSDDEVVTQRELSRRTSSDPNTVRAMLLLLEARGLVIRRRHPADGRARAISLTSKGRRAYARLWAASEPVRTKLLAALQSGEASQLLGLLGRVASAVCPRAGENRLLYHGGE